MKYFVLILLVACALIRAGENPPGCHSEGLEVAYLKAQVQKLNVELEIARNPLVMRVRLAEAEAQGAYDKFRASEKKESKDEKAPN